MVKKRTVTINHSELDRMIKIIDATNQAYRALDAVGHDQGCAWLPNAGDCDCWMYKVKQAKRAIESVSSVA